MPQQTRFARYRELQEYVGWEDEDARLLVAIAPAIRGAMAGLIDDFYEAIERHPATRRVITGGHEQIERLKGKLREWLDELFAGRYDSEYVERRWRVGFRHVEIGLDQVYTNVALSRLRGGLTRAIQELWPGGAGELRATVRALNRLLDLDLALIEDAYQSAVADRLQRAERLATLGQIAGGVAHELRNPLNVVKTSAYYLLHARDPSAEKVREHLRRIERHVGLADGVITSLSNFARLPAPVLRPTSLPDVLAQVLEADRPGPGVEVAIDLPAGLPRVQGDEAQLRIVFGNLVRNALDAMPAGGRLTLSARDLGDAVEIDVCDTGEGIPKEHIHRVLEPLYSTKTRGLGLGLAIVRSILEKGHGSLRLESEPGRGSRFTVRLESSPEDGEIPA
jgi:signal transduction histidine kinase